MRGQTLKAGRNLLFPPRDPAVLDLSRPRLPYDSRKRSATAQHGIAASAVVAHSEGERLKPKIKEGGIVELRPAFEYTPAQVI